MGTPPAGPGPDRSPGPIRLRPRAAANLSAPYRQREPGHSTRHRRLRSFRRDHELLLTQLVPSQDGVTGPHSVIADFLALADTPATTPITPDAFPVQFNAFRLLHKIGVLLKKFDIPDAEVERVFTLGPSLGPADLAHLPLATRTSRADQHAVRRLAAHGRLRPPPTHPAGR